MQKKQKLWFSLDQTTVLPTAKNKGRWQLVKPWLGVAGLFGAGFLPCPECGAPLLWHFWPIAAVLAFYHWIKQRRSKQPQNFSPLEEDVTEAKQPEE